MDVQRVYYFRREPGPPPAVKNSSNNKIRKHVLFSRALQDDGKYLPNCTVSLPRLS